MQGDYKIVEYENWCYKCKHKKQDSNDEPCNECLTEFVNIDSHKPTKFKEID